MKPSGIVALVAAGVVIGGGVATYELTKPASGSVQVNYVDPAATTQPTTAPTTATVTVAPSATTTTSKASVAVTSKSTKRTATVQKEATVAKDTAPAQTSTTTATRPIEPASPSGPPPVQWGSNDQSLKPSTPAN